MYNVNKPPFTEEEIDEILHSNLSAKELAIKLGRTVGSIRTKKYKLEHAGQLNKNWHRAYYKKHDYSYMGCHKPYTCHEIDLILYSTMSDIELAKMIKRSVSSIQNKRTRLVHNRA